MQSPTKNGSQDIQIAVHLFLELSLACLQPARVAFFFLSLLWNKGMLILLWEEWGIWSFLVKVYRACSPTLLFNFWGTFLGKENLTRFSNKLLMRGQGSLICLFFPYSPSLHFFYFSLAFSFSEEGHNSKASGLSWSAFWVSRGMWVYQTRLVYKLNHICIV